MPKKNVLTKSIVIKPKAYQDLTNIYQYSYQNFGTTKARQHIDNIDEAFNTLAVDVTLARNCDFISKGLLAYNVISHIIFFRQNTDTITIVRILHKAMDYQRHI